MTSNKYKFRLHVTTNEIEQRIDDIISCGGGKEELELMVHKPLLETFENSECRHKHNQYKRAYAQGYAKNELKHAMINREVKELINKAIRINEGVK
jgi:hypothetical protein